MGNDNADWQRKGATLSDKTARQEFGLTYDEIVRAIRAGRLQYRQNSIFGNPFLRLLRREVEALVRTKHGANYLADRQTSMKLKSINRELKQLVMNRSSTPPSSFTVTAFSSWRRAEREGG